MTNGGELRATELSEELRTQGSSAADARKEIDAVIDRWVYYAGWSDASRSQSPYAIFDFQEMKTVWHPVGM
jgi:hypothetical protein